MAQNLPARYTVDMDKSEVRREYLRRGGDIRATADALGISRPTVYRTLRSLPPLVIPSVTLKGATDDSPDSTAVRAYVRLTLDRVGILKEPPASHPTDPERAPTGD